MPEQTPTAQVLKQQVLFVVEDGEVNVEVRPIVDVFPVERSATVLLIWRHRFIIDRWVPELPGGYVDTPSRSPGST